MADQFNKIDIFGKNIDINDSVYDNDKDRFAQYTYDTKKDDFAQYTYDTKKDNFAQHTYDTKKDDFATNTYNTKKNNFAAYTLSNNVGEWQGRDVVNNIVWTDLRASFAWWTVWHTPTAEDPADWNGPYNIYVAIRQSAFDAAHPVGETYTQYPMQDPPATLYNKNGITSEWTPVTDYQGCFFRAEGGYAAAFTEKGNPLAVQGYQNAYHNHEMDHTHGIDHVHYTSGTTDGSKANITIDDGGSHTHSYYGRDQDGIGNGIAYSEACGTGTVITTISTSENGSHSHTITQSEHTHTWGAWSGSAYKDDHVTGRPLSDGASRTTTSYNGDVYAQESRPTNVTIRIWIRTR